MSDNVTKLKMYSLGIVTEDKKRGSDFIKAYPIEELPFANGKISEQKIKYDVKGSDVKGVDRSEKLDGDLTIVAKWIPYGTSNRSTSPDVIKNETVLIFKYADTDEYFWTTIAHEPHLRRLETVRYPFGNLPKGILKYDSDSSYWLEVSTHDKHIKLHTSKSDGEPFVYDITLDTGNGTLEIKDDAGNSIFLDSMNNKAVVTTNDDIELNTTRVVVNATESIKYKTVDFMVDATLTTLDCNLLVKGSISTSSGKGGDGASISGDISNSGDLSTGNITADTVTER